MSLFTRPGFRVSLRPIRLDDVDEIMTWVNDPDVVRNFASMGQITREQELAFLQKTIDSNEDRLYAVLGPSGQYLGNAGIHKIYWPARNGRLGIVIGAKGEHGQGYGQETLKLLISLGFEELGLHKLWLVHYAENARMLHLARKLGFVEEGVLRDEYFHGGRFHDMLRHSLLEQEYATLSWVQKNHNERGV
jgi:RimJ/RimL family protein N-acetyltransferase